MTVLRSREIFPSPKTKPKSRKTPQNDAVPSAMAIQPCTPKKTTEPSPASAPASDPAPRRSARLAGRSGPDSAGARVPAEVEDSAVESLKGKRKKPSEDDNNGGDRGARFTREEKGKRRVSSELDSDGIEITVQEDTSESKNDSGEAKGRSRYLWWREDRVKKSGIEDSSESSSDSSEDSSEEDDDPDCEEILDRENAAEIERAQEALERNLPLLREQRLEQAAARERAEALRRRAHFARGFGGEEEEDGDREVEINDWPGPFSTAMKIIRDRERRTRRSASEPASDSAVTADVEWVPRSGGERSRSRLSPPTLMEMSMKALLDNPDRLVSLYGIADSLRTRMSKLLSDSRRLDGSFFRLLLQDSPMEVCVSDCSWLTEEEFTQATQGFDPTNLAVLQLDQCGRCLPDYILLTTLARFSNNFSALNTVSLRGACRLSDVGLRSLVSSAPSLTSLNLGQCSLLTHSSIEAIAESLGSVLRKLFLDDCQGIDAMLMIPALKKLKKLEAFSVARIETVCNEFIKEFVDACGQNIKELGLTDCVKLNDSSVEVIAEKCQGLLTIDLSKCKLTDYALGYLANGCRLIQVLRFRGNSFSDKGVAAFLETSGQSLEDLSLNSVKKVGCQTALSIVKSSAKLQRLDLSWCRDLTDNALGLIVDNCPSLSVLRLFGCTQITGIFVKGHSNPELKIIGLQASPLLQDFWKPNW